jgi:hypothetical protein
MKPPESLPQAFDRFALRVTSVSLGDVSTGLIRARRSQNMIIITFNNISEIKKKNKEEHQNGLG